MNTDKSGRGRWFWVTGLTLVLLVPMFFIRFIDLDRDPPLVTGSGSEWSDPGIYLYSVRSALLFGEWRRTNIFYATPGYQQLVRGWSALLGFSYSHVVLLAILCGTIVILLSGWIAMIMTRFCHAEVRYRSSFAAIMSLTLSYVWFAHSHSLRGDMESYAVCMLGALFLVYADVWRRRGKLARAYVALAAGTFAAGIAPFVKIFAITFTCAFAAAWFFSFWLLDEEWKAFWKRANRYIAAGAFCAMAVWLIWLAWLNSLGMIDSMLTMTVGMIQNISPTITRVAAPALMNPAIGHGTPFSLGWFFESNLFYRQPVETVFGVLAVCIAVFLKRWTWPTLLLVCWILAGIAILSVTASHPMRYRLQFLPAAVILGAALWTELSVSKLPELQRVKVAICLVAGLVIGYVTAYGLLERLDIDPELTVVRNTFWILVLIMAPSAAFLLNLVLTKVRQQTIALAAAIALIGIAIPQWLRGESNRSHELNTAGQYVQTNFPHAVLAGTGWAMEIALFTTVDSECLPLIYGTDGPIPGSPVATQFIEEPIRLSTYPPAFRWHKVGVIELRRINILLIVGQIDR